jgi:hypothetical protein
VAVSGASGRAAADLEGHVVQFYGGDEELAASVSGYVGRGIEAGDSVLIVATSAHRLAFETALAAAGVDVGAAEAADRLVMLDAAEALQQFCTGDRLDRVRFDSAVGGLLQQVAEAGRPVRIYAEMVALLWDAGQVMLALELEELWNDLGARFPFSLLCAYPARLVADGNSAGSVEAVCRLHTGVMGSRPGPAGEDDMPGRGAEAVRSFPQALEAARAARQFVVGLLRWRDDQALSGDAAIVAAELATNAVMHARSGFTVAVAQSADSVRISVRDASPAPVNRAGSLVATPGHGLDVVSKIARGWAVEPLPDGKAVWAELPASPHQAR